MSQREIIRSFVCVEIPADIKRIVGKFLDELKKEDKSVKWVREENLHITIKFLGEEPRTKVEKMKSSLEEGIPELGVKPFNLSLKRVGAFPDWSRPRVIWVGIEGEGTESLRVIRDFVERTARKHGFQKESKPFSPHITLGRIKKGRIEPSLLDRLRRGKDIEFGSFRVLEVVLMRSQLFPDGPVYSPLATFALEGG